MRGISHVAIGVRDMDRSLAFYRDLLGLRVTLDTIEKVGGAPGLLQGSAKSERRAVYLRWDDGPEATFIVLSAPAGPPSGEAIRLDQVGIHHFSFWVERLEEKVEALRAAGVPILAGPFAADTVAYGEAPGGKVLTCLFADPDGIILQLDERFA